MRCGIATLLLLLLPTTASATYMSPAEVKAAPRLFAIDFGPQWDSGRDVQRPGYALTAVSRRKECGSDTFITFKSDFDNDLAYATPEAFFAKVTPQQVTALLRRMYYPTGELRESDPPTRGTFANAEAYNATYRLTFASGKGYYVRYHLVFASGYLVHVQAHSDPRDRLISEPCFNTLFETLRFRTNAPTPTTPETPTSETQK